MRVKFLDLRPSIVLESELNGAYYRVMQSGVYIGGPEVESFEREWADYCEGKYCISCSSGQAALELLLRAFGYGCGDVVTVPSWTAAATWKAVLNIGGIVEPIEPDGFTIDGINIAVSLYGYKATGKINDVCQGHGLKGFDNAAFSFYPTKNLGSYGDGGAIITNDVGIATYCLEHRASARLDPLQAAFLRVKLKYLDKYNEIRANNASLYDDLLPDTVIKPPKGGVYHQYVIRLDRRDQLKTELAERGIETMIHYPLPPHRQIGLDLDLPMADRLAKTVLSLPIMTDEKNVKIVAEAINELASAS